MPFTDVKYKFKKIGQNVDIGENVYFRYPEAVEIGNNVIIDEFCYFTTALIIEDYVHISAHCSVIGGKESNFIMREFSTLSAGCRIFCRSDDFINPGINMSHIPSQFRNLSEPSTVELKSHVVLGTSNVCHPGVTIGEGVSTGSMSLINRDLDPWWVYFGIPAKKYKPKDQAAFEEKVKEFRKYLKIKENK